jgi:hypothetical protein
LRCTNCGDLDVVIIRSCSELCQFCLDCLRHELKISTDAVRDFGSYAGPKFFAIYYTGEHTLGYPLYLPRTPQEAMRSAIWLAMHNGWKLIRLDVQKTLTDIFVSSDYHEYMEFSRKQALPYDVTKYGALWQ